MSVSNIHTSVELPPANSTYNYNFLSAKSIRRDTHKLRGTNSPKPSVSIIDEIANSDCCSTQPASSAKPSRESLAVSEIEVTGKSGQKFACFEVDETMYHLPSQEISPISSISELSSETETMEANKVEIERPFKTTYGTIDTEESAEEFPKIKSIQSVRLSPLALLKTFLDPVSPKGSDNERITFKKSSFYKREQDSQNNSQNSDIIIPPQKNLYNTAASFETLNHKRKGIGKFYTPSNKLSLFKETNEPSILSQTNGNISLPQTPKLQSPKGNSAIYQLNNKTAGSITMLTTKKQEVIRISRGLNGFDSGDRNILKSSLEFYKPKTHNKFDVNNFYRQPEEKLF